MGSGGHTAEMIRLLSGLPFERYTPRIYLISSGDSLSKSKIIQLENFKQVGQYSFHEIPRARRVNQSFFTSVFTTSHSLAWCFWLIAIKPIFLRRSTRSVTSSQRQKKQVSSDVILLNGPGSAVPIALSAFAAKLIMGQKISTKLIYVESFARITSLSLTGTALLPFMNCFVVQWQTLYNTIHQSKLYQFLYGLKLVPSITFDGWMV